MLPKFDEPEVIDLAHFLNDSGACVYGAGTDKLLIKGKCHLHGSEYVVPPDRIEAGTFILAAAITRSITQFNHDTLEVSSMPSNVGDHMQGFDIKTGPFPGFPTDLQPPTMALRHYSLHVGVQIS
ncbi:hypothetical protein LWI28_006074 [Acer negundo]|uniref:UDP-N-acetylglucosamine 1-carboxyvinyltransferase n=1 Tax=Acer negundo TaxID=4023 RepID=A0AAD5NVY7_ACENE|nr:hypothetical protein LWI28_006074 [Acer negundo]